jgi:hypothetical protein
MYQTKIKIIPKLVVWDTVEYLRHMDFPRVGCVPSFRPLNNDRGKCEQKMSVDCNAMHSLMAEGHT